MYHWGNWESYQENETCLVIFADGRCRLGVYDRVIEGQDVFKYLDFLSQQTISGKGSSDQPISSEWRLFFQGQVLEDLIVEQAYA